MLNRSSNIKIIYFSRSPKSLGKSFQGVWTPKGIPPIRDHDHAIHLIPGSVPQNIRPYRYPYVQKNEIELMIAEMLEVGIMQPSQSSFSSLVVLVHKMDGSWCMCPDYRELISSPLKINFPFLWLMNYWMNYMEQFILPSWIFVQDIIKLEWRLKIF